MNMSKYYLNNASLVNLIFRKEKSNSESLYI